MDLLTTNPSYQRKSVMVKRDRWILTGYDGRTIDVTTAKAWVDLYEKKQVDFSDLYDTDLAKRVIPRYKPVRDDTLFLEKISGATKQTKYESEPQWIFPAPHVDRQKVPTGLAVFVYLPTSRELVASIDAVYHSDRTVYVENVNTRLDYRGNGLCKIMFTTLVTYLYKTGRARHIRLFNATGDIGCKCYVKGAEAGGFLARDRYGDKLSSSRCEVLSEIINFYPRSRLTEQEITNNISGLTVPFHQYMPPGTFVAPSYIPLIEDSHLDPFQLENLNEIAVYDEENESDY